MTDIFGWQHQQQQQQLRMQETEKKLIQKKKSLHIDPGFLIFDTRLGLVWFGWMNGCSADFSKGHTEG